MWSNRLLDLVWICPGSLFRLVFQFRLLNRKSLSEQSHTKSNSLISLIQLIDIRNVSYLFRLFQFPIQKSKLEWSDDTTIGQGSTKSNSLLEYDQSNLGLLRSEIPHALILRWSKKSATVPWKRREFFYSITSFERQEDC